METATKCGETVQGLLWGCIPPYPNNNPVSKSQQTACRLLCGSGPDCKADSCSSTILENCLKYLHPSLLLN